MTTEKYINETSDRADDSTGSKLLREVSVLGSGAISGIADSASDAWHHPGESALKVGGGFVVGAGLALLTRGRYMGPLAESIGAAATVSFVGDVAMKLPTVGSAWNDVWQGNEQSGHDKMAGVVGPAVVDFGLLSAGAIGGGFAGRAARLRMDQALSSKLDSASLASADQVLGVNGWKRTGFSSGDVLYESPTNKSVNALFRDQSDVRLMAGEQSKFEALLTQPGSVDIAKLRELGQLTSMQTADTFKLTSARVGAINDVPVLITEGSFKNNGAMMRSYYFRTGDPRGAWNAGEVHFHAPKGEFKSELPNFERLLSAHFEK